MQILFDDRSDSFDLLDLNAFELMLIQDALLDWHREMNFKPDSPLMHTILSQDEHIRGALDRLIRNLHRQESEGDNVGGA